MNLKCMLGLHDWKTEYFGGGYPFRECRRCHKCEVKPIGTYYWHKPAEGNTLESTRRFHTMFNKQNLLAQQRTNGTITESQFRDEMDKMREQLEEGVKVHEVK